VVFRVACRMDSEYFELSIVLIICTTASHHYCGYLSDYCIRKYTGQRVKEILAHLNIK
jgi:hypothetical protein